MKVGKLVALAVTTVARSQALPDIPAASEFAPGYEASSLFGIGAPRDTPAEIIQQLNREIGTTLADPKIEARVADLGGMAHATSVRRFRQASRRRNGEMGKVIRVANIRLE